MLLTFLQDASLHNLGPSSAARIVYVVRQVLDMPVPHNIPTAFGFANAQSDLQNLGLTGVQDEATIIGKSGITRLRYTVLAREGRLANTNSRSTAPPLSYPGHGGR